MNFLDVINHPDTFFTRQRTGKMMVAPKPETVFPAGDVLVALGAREQLTKLGELGN